MNDNYKDNLLNLFISSNGRALSDRELLELLFSITNPRTDYRKISADVLLKFDSFSKAINTTVKKLSELNSMTEMSITALKLIGACGKRISQEDAHKQKSSLLAEWDKFIDFCRQNMAYEDVEEVRVFLLDENFHCFDNKVISKGTVNHASAHPRDIIELATNLKAKHIILTHNHPSGNCKPSNEDNNFTRIILEAAEGANLNIFDHLIITDKQVYSYRENGFFAKNPKD